jgi:hypothetical protein
MSTEELVRVGIPSHAGWWASPARPPDRHCRVGVPGPAMVAHAASRGHHAHLSGHHRPGPDQAGEISLAPSCRALVSAGP